MLITALGLSAFLVFGWWSFKAIDKTAEQRNRLIDLVFEHPEWDALIPQFRDVSFDAHYHAVLLCRDPMRLYSQSIRELAA